VGRPPRRARRRRLCRRPGPPRARAAALVGPLLGPLAERFPQPLVRP
jgi:hypothetical protein